MYKNIFVKYVDRNVPKLRQDDFDTMSSDPDACLPAPVRDFVFDLHDSSRRSLIGSDQVNLYNNTFKELTGRVRYFVIEIPFKSIINAILN